MKKIILITVLFLSLYTPVSAQEQNTYYVDSVIGNDANSCTEPAPCKTWGRVQSVANAGDKIVMTGTFQPFAIAKCVYVLGDNAIVDGSLVSSQSRGIVVKIQSNDVNCVTVDNFQVTKTRSHAIIAERGTSATFKNNFVFYAVLEGLDFGQRGSCIKAEFGVNVVFTNNTVHDCHGEGFGVTVSGSALIENNTVLDAKHVGLYVDNSYSATVRYNKITCTGKASALDQNGKRAVGIGIGEEFYQGWGARQNDLLMQGNDLYGCNNSISIFQSDVGGTLKNMTMTDNWVTNGVGNVAIGVVHNRCQAGTNFITNNKIYRTNIYLANGCTNIQLSGNVLSNITPTPQGTVLPFTLTSTFSVTVTNTPTRTPTLIPTNTRTITPSRTPTATRTPTLIITPTSTPITTTTPECFNLSDGGKICYWSTP